MQRDRLRGVERFAVPLAETINKRRGLKRLIHETIGRFDCTWINWTTKPLHQITGLDPATV